MASVLQGEIDFWGVMEGLPRMPHQHEFVTTEAYKAAYVGGNGSGKTAILCALAILNASAEPNGYSLIGRLNMPALESTTMKTFLEMVPQEWGVWTETKKTFSFHNGHVVVFKHLDTSDPKLESHLRSMNLSWAYIDEATEISEEIYLLLIGRLRRKTAKRRGIRLASNPAGHDWVWRHFFDPDRPKGYAENKGITASSMDNVFLAPEYIENMLNTYPPDWRDRFIYGSFSDFSDLVYKEFTEPSHVWDAGKQWKVFAGENMPPKHWPAILGIDIGSDIDPWAIPIIAVSPWGSLFQYAEVYGSNMLIASVAEQIQEKLNGRKVSGIAYDYANRQAALELAECDIVGTAAIKEVRPGLFKCAQYFHIDPRLEHPFNPEIQGAPRYFMSSECVHTRREHSVYKWQKDKSGTPNGEPAHENSHSPDGVRYAIHTFRPLPEKLQPPKMWENPELDAISREYWKSVEQFKDKMERFKPVGGEQKTIQEWQREALRGPRRFVRPYAANFRRN